MTRIKILSLVALWLMVACKNTSAEKANLEEKTSSETVDTTATTVSSTTSKTTDEFPEQAESAIGFVPPQWNVIMRKEGDLNKDNLADVAMIVEKNDPKNIVITDSDTLNTNPRALLVLLKQKNGTYRLAAKNNNGFVESPQSEEDSFLIDPVADGELEIKNNTLLIDFKYSYLSGSWENTYVKYVFRYQNDRFELIGVEYDSYSKNTGENVIKSFNLSTNRLEITTGGNVFEESENKPKKQVKRKVYDPKPVLDSLGITPYEQILHN